MDSRTSSFGRADQILGMDGSVLTLADLPPRNLKRWVARRKADVIAAVIGGLLTKPEACARYNISREEFSAWLDAFEHDGLAGLRARANARGMRVRQVQRAEEFSAAPEFIPHAGLD